MSRVGKGAAENPVTPMLVGVVGLLVIVGGVIWLLAGIWARFRVATAE